MARQMKIVRLLEPEMCLDCRFAHMADVEAADGTMQRMIYCRRLDCDNWDFGSAEPAKSVRVEEDEAA
ncbi:MAG TPA: hypothetical protein VM328_11645 [Fimbriimonadaceae bacterium]|nr:hypothetical protein [Fimbriimonadaceae bacterium]